jgi:hypothetical protein
MTINDDNEGKDAEIGDTISAATVDVAAHVTGGSGNFLQLWRDGERLEQVEITSDDFRHTFSDDVGEGKHRRYRLELINDANNRIVVTSHIYVDGLAGSGGGCCDGGGAGSALASLPVLPLLLRRRRRLQ